MAPQNQAASRSSRLSKFFWSVTKGDRPIRSSFDAKLLLEAICDQEDRASCVEKLIASRNALDGLKLGLRFDVSVDFINGPLLGFLSYLKDPVLKKLCNGDFLKQLLTIIVQPSTLWTAISDAYGYQQLVPEWDVPFAWLLLELVSWTDEAPVDASNIAQDMTDRKIFLHSGNRELRSLGYRIQHVLLAKTSSFSTIPSGPGGRHNNDFEDYRKIAIYPTDDELVSKETPFYRRADAIVEAAPEQRVAIHLDNQFRLLRENFLAELREDIKITQGNKKSRRAKTKLCELSLHGLYCGTERNRSPLSITVTCKKGLEKLIKVPSASRRAFLRDNPRFLKNNAFGCVMDEGRVITFAKLQRDQELLERNPPVVTLQTPNKASLEKLLFALKLSRTVDFLIVDTAVFAYEPVLSCLQAKVELPLWEELLSIRKSQADTKVTDSPISPIQLLHEIEQHNGEDLKQTLKLSKRVHLDESQKLSLLSALKQAVSLIQGPPGTGKSFIGALLAKAILDYTSEKMLIICFTNHALDQFIEDVLDIGVPDDYIVRLGSRSSNRTRHLKLEEQAASRGRSQQTRAIIDRLKGELREHEDALKKLLASYSSFNFKKARVLEHLEFSGEDSDYFHALQVPHRDPGENIAGKRGKRIDEFYLFQRWSKGLDAGIFKESIPSGCSHVWELDREARKKKMQDWRRDLLQEIIADIRDTAEVFDTCEKTLRQTEDKKRSSIIQQKRVIACTTTGAAMWTQQLQSASPGVILVEEAGEILESHVLTAMNPSTKQLILIGDHRQLRPKVNNYALTVEKGDGYDLNRSLFERLILAGFPHTTLQQQHRMCPEISSIVRHLTYPELLDAPKTLKRGPIFGLQSRVVFIDHRNLELTAAEVADRRDEGASVSKQNGFEVAMILKIVRYMAQQGYGTDDQVVLTPYLGQLSLLRKMLSKENDPVLNDLDSFELVKAGLLNPASAAQTKRPINISTIDNYQGEESDIVIVSLTRSNKQGDIGFMASPERLNVLLSRARRGLILIGNSETFLASRKGKALWGTFFNYLSKNNLVFDGLPVKCERHPDVQKVLKSFSDFEKHCPEGGCSTPCGSKLNCGLHECPRKCHRLSDHSKIQCMTFLEDYCPQKHRITWRCCERRPASCATCDEEAHIKAEKQQRDMELDNRRQAKQREYAQQLAAIQDEIAQQQALMKERREDEERESVLRQRRKDLENLQAGVARARAAKVKPQSKSPVKSAEAGQPQQAKIPGSFPADSKTPSEDYDGQSDKGNQMRLPESEARKDWEDQKKLEGAQNDALDELMDMIGLENVKEEFLSIKSKIDVAIRQNIDMKKERFGAALLGNPGTGKTTVARLYARFLTSVGALPGSFVVETTGAKLANEGVPGAKKTLNEILNSGGGALFIDEAYQLASGSSPGGAAVLDYLLAEVENQTGKVVFILAGYNKQMEAFFAHNPGLPSRFPREIQFKDYEDAELLEILNYGIEKRWGGRMKLEGGSRGLYARIVARRIGRGRGKEGFGNARAVENALATIAARQAKRLRKERRSADKTPDDLLFTKGDLIGPEPSDALSGNQSWGKLQKLIGLGAVKESVKALFDSIQFNYQRELDEEPLVEFTLNKVFLGSPGTGKTTVAKLYGQILADIGLLSSGEVVVKTPADFIGNVIGASEANTKGILASTVGKVLVIDEAYGLHGGKGGSSSDPYKTAIIDTIVAEVQSVPGDERCVVMLGYKEQMEEMMQNTNPGLARRFPLDSAFVFEDFADDELAHIFDLKLKMQGFKTTDKARSVALEMLSRARNRPHFGNAGEVDILLNNAKIQQQKRMAKEGKPSGILEAHDFDPDFERGQRAVTDVEKLFEGVVGCENVVAQLQGYQTTAANMKALGMDPREQIPFAFLFRGPPGTGKTSTARRMGKVYYDMGFLATAEVVECSATDLVGEFVGQTGPKTQKLLENALGKVLFIDEAYRLAEGHFAKEAMDELVDCITKPKFFQKLVVILAGYDADINRLMSINPGLTSRFPETVVFRPMNAEECLALLTQILGKKKHLDASVITSPSPDFRAQLLHHFTVLATLDNFASARDVQTVAKAVFGRLMKTSKPSKGVIVVSEQVIVEEMKRMITERAHRATFKADIPTTNGHTPQPSAPQMQTKQAPLRPNTQMGIATDSSTQEAKPPRPQEDVPPTDTNGSGDPPHDPSRTGDAMRDAGVSDAVWAQLQRDKQRAEQEERERQRLEEEERKLKEWLKKCEDARRQRELDEIERRRKELEERRRREEREQAKLQSAGRCPVGYRWIRQSGGYRCAGGSHWVSDGEVRKLMG